MTHVYGLFHGGTRWLVGIYASREVAEAEMAAFKAKFPRTRQIWIEEFEPRTGGYITAGR